MARVLILPPSKLLQEWDSQLFNIAHIKTLLQRFRVSAHAFLLRLQLPDMRPIFAGTDGILIFARECERSIRIVAYYAWGPIATGQCKAVESSARKDGQGNRQDGRARSPAGNFGLEGQPVNCLIGIECVTTEAHRLAALEASARAQKLDIEVLPWPLLGKPYSFTLTTLDGRQVRSSDLKGKVVLVDCWFSACSPCIHLFSELKQHYKKWHASGLEVIGICSDQSVDAARQTCTRHALPWPQVLVPVDEDKRALWMTASGINAMPRVLIIDREGILRADGAANIEETLAKLLGR